MANARVPDFTQATQYINQAAAEFSQQIQLLNTTPAVLLQQITAQLQRIDQQLQQLNQRMTAMDAKLDNLNSNMVARLQNSYARSSQDHLMPLLDSTTGVPIPQFPMNSQAITQMNANQCRTMLQHLGQVAPQNQGVAFLRRQLRIQIGLPADQFNAV